MEEIVNVTISEKDIVEAERKYQESKKNGREAEIQGRFQYAHALLRSTNGEEVKRGLDMLENLYKDDPTARRDYLYYIAIGQARLKQYEKALDCMAIFLKYEPENRQAIQLKEYFNDELKKNAIKGMAFAGGAVLFVGSLIGLAINLSRK